MIRLTPILFLLGCNYRLAPEARICEDVGFAISERTLVCTDDTELANRRFEQYEKARECLLSDKVERPYNPEGILPPDDNPEGEARLARAYGCVLSIRKAPCEDVLDNGEDISWWLSLDAGCADVATAEGAFEPPKKNPDTGTP